MGKINLNYLESMTDGDNEVMIEMIQLLIEETPKHLDSIKKAQDEKNWMQLRSEAHKIKPMMLYVGLDDLNEACQQLEENAKNGEASEANSELIEKLENGFDEVVDDLKAKIAELS